MSSFKDESHPSVSSIAPKLSSPVKTVSNLMPGYIPTDICALQSNKRAGLSEPKPTDASAAVEHTAFQYDSKDDIASYCPLSETASSSKTQSEAVAISDPLRFLQQGDQITSDEASFTSDDSQEHVSRSERRYRKTAGKQLRKERLAANRRSASNAIQRRKIYIEELQNSLSSLVKENFEFHRENNDLKKLVEQLQEENRELTASLNNEIQSSSPAVCTFVYVPKGALPTEPAMGNAHFSTLDSGATAIASLDIRSDNTNGALCHQTPNSGSPAIAKSNVKETPLVGPIPINCGATVGLSTLCTQSQ